MKLIRFGNTGAEQPGLLLADGRRVVVPSFCRDFDEGFFGSGGMRRLEEWAAEDLSGAEEVPAEVRWGAPVARPSKIVCVGLNYRAHAMETGAAIPGEPVIFMKATSAWNGPFDEVWLPPGSQKLDWEVELAVVIGKTMRRVPEAEALDHVAGYGVMNDYSERAWQKERGGQWSKGKGGDTFAPFGPWLATPDELPAGPGALGLSLSVSGVVQQESTTGDLIFGVAHVLSYISHFMTLLPGDVVSTGTPSGVGAGQVPERYLKVGDVVEATVAGLGTQRQRVVETPVFP
jgi:2-keto-4-pentenoate hydratase/2-oxohepta-3-ene-1,7-dioic acid hydratase in catechol pathway